MEVQQAELPARIKAVYNSCSHEEQKILRTILQELAKYGYSTTYEQVWLADYKEIPVDKKTFLTHPYYLGNTNNNGASIYPAWMEVMLELERTGNQYNEIVFTGATRTGKTSTAVSDACYQLYRIMCMRDPQSYFGLKPTTTILFFFFNLTAALAKGVAFKEMMTTISESPWFMEHGHMNKSEATPTYIPDGKIEMRYGSDSSQALGLATYCLVGETKILTSQGVYRLDELAGENVAVAQYTPHGDIEFSNADVICTGFTDTTIRVELEDGTVFEGTPDHKVLLVTGEYKQLQDLSEADDILSFNDDLGGGSVDFKNNKETDR